MIDVPKYKRLFGIKVPLAEFSPMELKRRWRVLCHKYHPDHGGTDEHFGFVQEAYKYLKKHCMGEKDSNATSFDSEIGEIKVPLENGGYMYLWDVGEPDFDKQVRHYEKYSHFYKGRKVKVKI